ncbi:MAG: hypothetical protein MOP51_1935 [Citricoccus sp.]|nr:hypothetical protein [Citricoccus sp. WCRC_4]
MVIALTGCEAGEPDTGPGTDPPPESRAPIADPGDAPGPGLGIPTSEGTDRGSGQAAGTRAPHVHQTAQGTCDDLGAAQALRLSTTDPAATGILDQWDACLRTDTTPAYTWLRNRTGAVWILRTTPWDVVQEHRPGRTRLGTLQSGVMHRAAQERGKASNASAFILPGESIWIAAEPGTVTAQVGLPLTVAWAGAGEILARLDDHGQGLLTDAIDRRESGPSTAVACVLALHDSALRRTDLYTADLQDVLRDGFEDILADEECAEPARETIMGRRGRTVSVLDDVLEVIPGSASTLEQISSELEPYRRVYGTIALEPVTPAGGESR